MAGDGGRVPDVSEQRAEVERMDDPHRAKWFELCRSLTPGQTDVLREGLERRARRAFESGRESAAVRSDPASVLAALLAEQPDATITALETLLTSDEAVEVVARFVSQMWHHAEDVDVDDWDRQDARKLIPLVCRSLLSKAPK